MTALYILFGLIAVILLVLSIPVHALVRYGDEMELDLRYLFWKFHILPTPEKPEEPEEEKQEEPEKKPKKTGEKKPNPVVEKFKKYLKAEGFGGFMNLIGTFLKLTGTTAVRIIKKFRIHDFDLYLMVGGGDAAEAAILYGKVCAAVYPASEVLFRLVKCKKRRLSIDLSYSVPAPYVKLEADVSIRPIFVVDYILRYVGGVIPLIKRFFWPKKKKNKSVKA